MPDVADLNPLHTILYGDLPLLVAREFARLALAAPDLRLLGPIVGGAELAQRSLEVRAAVVVATAAQLPVLARLGYAGRVLLYAPAAATGPTAASAGPWAANNTLEPLPYLVAERPRWRQTLVQALRLAAVPPLAFAPRLSPRPAVAPPAGLVIIGASTGGPSAVETLLARLHPESRCAVLVAVHLPHAFTASLVARLRRASVLPVAAAGPGTRFVGGQVLVVPGGTNMVVRSEPAGHWSTCLAAEPLTTGSDVPSVDLLMCSAATAVNRVLGVVLTGLGHDGTRGAQAIRERGGQVLVQDADSAAVFSMPGAVLRAGWASAVLPLAGLAAAINQFGEPARREAASSGPKPASSTAAHAV